MQKRLKYILPIAALLVLLSITAYAADGEPGFWMSLWDWIKSVFVPSPDYFSNKMAVLNDKLNTKLGGVAYLFLMLRYFFKTLDTVPDAGLMLNIPSGFYFEGYSGLSLDLLTTARPFIRVFRGVSTGAICIFTAIAIYHKLRTMFEQ